jgi:predicted metal-dependent hydrolase
MAMAPGPASLPESLPPGYRAFLQHFAAGHFWEAHEVLESDWRVTRSGFYKALILLASAYVHAGRGNAHGVEAQLRKTARELEPYAPFYLGQDVDALLALARQGPPLPAPPDLTPVRERFRGTEVELG